MTATFQKLVLDAVDSTAVQKAFAAARRMDFSSTRQLASAAIRPGALERIREAGADLGTVLSRSGQRGVLQVVRA